MLFSWLCHSIWLLFIYNMLKIPVFFIISLMGSMIGGFYWLLLWNFKK